MIDTSKPVPGRYRLPNANERRNRLYLIHPYQDVTTVCELNPDIQEHNDATLQLFADAPQLREIAEAAREVLKNLADDDDGRLVKNIWADPEILKLLHLLDELPKRPL